MMEIIKRIVDHPIKFWWGKFTSPFFSDRFLAILVPLLLIVMLIIWLV